VGLRPQPDSPEAGLWDTFDKVEQQAKLSADLNADPVLNAYVHEVACKVAAEYCQELRIYVMDRPFMNAAMASNGYSEVWSGLLLRVADEAELAFVLGHEASHFTENHSIERHEAIKTRANVAMAFSAGIAAVALVGAAHTVHSQGVSDIYDAAGSLVDLVYFTAAASLFSFTREQETEADILGLRRAAAAGYDTRAAASSWRSVLSESKASDFKSVRNQEARLGILDSHPLSSIRADALDLEASKLPVGGASGRERHRAAIRPFLGAWLKDDLRRKDYGQTLHVIDRLAATGEDLGVLNFYRGETYRLRRGEDDVELAKQAYEAAIAHSDAPVAAWRELGEARRRAGDRAGAAQAFNDYLEKAPDAEDAWLVRDTLNSLQGA
jgi:predicted Zn-dependent protease